MRNLAINTLTENIEIADLHNQAHADAIIFLLNEYAKDPMGGSAELSRYTKENLVNELQQRSGIFVVLAFVGESPAGIAIAIEGFSTFACKPLINIHDFAIAPAFRGRGLSKKLLTKVEAVARSKGCCKMTLEVLQGNQIAQTVYANFGFEGYALNETVGTAVFLQKKLADTNVST
jgi:ribosomal protein S18 acetylase RimI-like enzyme